MKKLIFFLYISIISSFLCFADLEGYKILDYSFYGKLHENNSISVTEEITVNFFEPRHGIYRSIPTVMHVAREVDGETKVLKYRNKIRNVSVENENYEWEEGAIKIGSASSTVLGNKKYSISYDLYMPDDRVDEGDLFFYSVLGDEWNVPIENFNFQIDFDKEFPESSNIQLYSGSFGNQKNSLGVLWGADKSSVMGRCHDVPSNSAITLYAELPEGYFIGAENLSSGIVWFFVILTIALSIWILVKVFNLSKKSPVKTVEFYAPEGVSSAEVGYIIDKTSNDIDLISLLPYLAEKGFIRIEENEGDCITVEKIKELPENSPSYMKAFFNLFFKKTQSFRISNLNEKFVNDFNAVKHRLSAEFTGERKLYKDENKAAFLSFAATALFGISIGLSGSEDRLGNLPFGIFSAFFMFMFSTVLRSLCYKKNFRRKSVMVSKVFLTGFSLAVSLGAVYICSFSMILPFAVYVFAALCVNAVNFFSPDLIVPTDYNLEISGKLMGLKEFIQKAEIPRLKVLYDENPSYFYNILPYAMVFGLTDKWSRVAKEFSVPKPDWYRNSRGMDYSFGRMAMLMNTSVKGQINEVREAMAKEAAKSAGGHSGFSGGGGGGGGGGSW